MTNLITRARDYATRAHAGQLRKYTDEPYINHPTLYARATALIEAYFGNEAA